MEKLMVTRIDFAVSGDTVVVNKIAETPARNIVLDSQIKKVNYNPSRRGKCLKPGKPPSTRGKTEVRNDRTTRKLLD